MKEFRDIEYYGDMTGQNYDGDILSKSNSITSLKGCPKEVTGAFVMDYNQLTTLDFCPEKLSSTFSLTGNPLTSLKGAPHKVGGNFFCDKTKIKNLEGTPVVVDGSYECGGDHLESLYTGRPIKITKDFDCKESPKLEDPIKEIIKNQIKADYYYTDKGKFDFKFIEKEFNAFVSIDKRVTRTSMRTLLGLDK